MHLDVGRHAYSSIIIAFDLTSGNTDRASCTATAVGLLATIPPSTYSSSNERSGLKKVGAAVVALSAIFCVTRNEPKTVHFVRQMNLKCKEKDAKLSYQDIWSQCLYVEHTLLL